jgi:hypothetical protein
VTYKQIVSDHNMGFDLSKDYETAQQLFSEKKGWWLCNFILGPLNNSSRMPSMTE